MTPGRSGKFFAFGVPLVIAVLLLSSVGVIPSGDFFRAPAHPPSALANARPVNSGPTTVIVAGPGTRPSDTALDVLPLKIAPCPPACAVTFLADPLPNGTLWYVEFNGTLGSSVSNTIVFQNVLNGTYSFVVGLVSGFSARPNTGSITVRGANVTQDISFSPTGILGLSAFQEYSLVIEIVALVLIAVAVVLLLRRRRKAPSAVATPPSSPDPGNPPRPL